MEFYIAAPDEGKKKRFVNEPRQILVAKASIVRGLKSPPVRYEVK